MSDHLSSRQRALLLSPPGPQRDIWAAALKEAGITLGVAGELREALQLLAFHDFDVAIVDAPVLGKEPDELLSAIDRFAPWISAILLESDAPRMPDYNKFLPRHVPLRRASSPSDIIAAVKAEAERRHSGAQAASRESAIRIQYQVDLLKRFSEAALTAENLHSAFDLLARGLARIIPFEAAALLYKDEDTYDLVVSRVEAVSPEFVQKVERELLLRYQALTGHQAKADDVQIRHEGIDDDEGGVHHLGNSFTIPITEGRDVRGLFMLASSSEKAFTGKDLSFVCHSASHLNTVIGSLDRIRRIAVRDVLTGLYNRRGIADALDRAWQVAWRYGHELGVVIIDVDHFKTLNDTYGHLVGDEILREFSQLLVRTARAADMAGRYGGDEMIMILPFAGEGEVRAFCDRFLAEVRRRSFCEKTHRLPITASLGAFSGAPTKDGLSSSEMLRMADQALYHAKRNGRNRVCHWNDLEQQPALAQPPAPEEAAGHRAFTVRGRVLLVDDDPLIGALLVQILQSEKYLITVETTGAGALKHFEQHKDLFDIVLVDLLLQNESGLDLLDHLKKIDDTVVPIVITGEATIDNAVASLRKGAYDFVEKPFKPDYLLSIMDRAMKVRRLLIENREYQLHLEEMVRVKSSDLSRALQELKESYNFTLEAFAALIDAKEQGTGEHSVRVSKLARVVAQTLGLPENQVEEIAYGALLHDIGKIAIPDAILLKPGPLTPAEWEIMRTHAAVGYNILRNSPHLKEVSRIVYEHQERYDGSGYPQALKGNDICQGARIFAVVDTYDAMRSVRSYSQPRSSAEAVDAIRKLSGEKFDPAAVDAFLLCVPQLEQIGRWFETASRARAARPPAQPKAT